MPTVIAEMSMSLDGFVADSSDEVGRLFDWYGNGEVETPTANPKRWTFRTSEASARHLRESLETVGALVAGLRQPVERARHARGTRGHQGTRGTHFIYRIRQPDRLPAS